MTTNVIHTFDDPAVALIAEALDIQADQLRQSAQTFRDEADHAEKRGDLGLAEDARWKAGICMKEAADLDRHRSTIRTGTLAVIA